MTNSAFGIDHGDVSKAFNPIKAVKAKGAKLGERSREKNYQRGFNQATVARGMPNAGGKPVKPTLGSLAPGFKRSDGAYRAGQQMGARTAQRHRSGELYENPFR